MLNTWISYF